MAMDAREWETWMAPAQVREYLRGNKPEKPTDLHPHTGLIDDEHTRRLLSHLISHYDPTVASRPMPARVEETKLYRILVQKAGTETVTKAIHQGDAQTQSFVVGDPAARSDISGIKAIQQLMDLLAQDAPILYEFGPPGSGKTNFGLLAAQMWKMTHPDGVLCSNIRTWEQSDKWIPSYGDLVEYLDQNLEGIEGGGVTQTKDAVPILFVFDEASSHASGRGEVGYEAGAKLGPLVYKIRKAKAGIIIIGHDGKDVHPAVRTLALCVKKPRDKKKEAIIYEDVIERRGVGEIVSLTGIPKTDYTYDHLEATSWSWEGVDESEEATLEQAADMAAEMEEDMVRRLAASLASDERLDLNQDEIGRVLGEAHRGEAYTRNWVSKWKRNFALGGDDE